MANITYFNNTPIPGLPFNPGLEDVLDPNGTISQANSTLFEITNNSGGPFAGFRFLVSSGVGDFTYVPGTNTPNGGNIDTITVLAPDGTIIIQATSGAFGDDDLADFASRLFDPTPSGVGAVFNALDRLLFNSNTVTGSAIADHVSAFGDNFALNTVIGLGGDDVLGVHRSGTYEIHGANADGSGGVGETNTLEIVGHADFDYSVDFDAITNIDALRFVLRDPPAVPNAFAGQIDVFFDAPQIGAGRVSPTLAVEGSTTASSTEISVSTESDPTATTGITVDLSGWTFTNWNEERNSVDIFTNNNGRALADTIIGSAVADEIFTEHGDDTLRGGGGADELLGEEGNDTFVYGLNEAVSGEEVDGGGGGTEGGLADRVLVLASNDFTGVEFDDIEQLEFGGAATATFDQQFISNPGALVIGNANANALAFELRTAGNQPAGIDLSEVVFQSWTAGTDLVAIRGTKSHDDISGSTQNDLIAGAAGKDDLQGNEGADAFLFDTAFGKGVDHIADFNRAEGDVVHLDDAAFTTLKPGDLKKKAFATGTEADDRKDRIIYDKEDGVLRYDDDGSGKHKAHIIAILDDASSLKFGDILVV